MEPNQRFKVGGEGIARPFSPVFSGQPSTKNPKYSWPFPEQKVITTDTGWKIEVKKNKQDSSDFVEVG